MNRILIAGAGRMGSWLALMLRDGHEVSVYDPWVEHGDLPSDVKYFSTVDEIGNFKPEMLLNCVSIGATISAFDELIGLLPDYCMLADIASVKGSLAEYYQSAGRRFVSIHPMFGPTFARFDNLKGLNTIIIAESDEAGQKFFANLLEPTGVNLSYASFAEHDKLMASVLAVPAISTLLFASGTNAFLTGGTSFARHKAIAEGFLGEEPQLVASIIAGTYSGGKIAVMAELLNKLNEMVETNDTDGIMILFRSIAGKFFKPDGLPSPPGPQ
ncbi:MAG: prephenate dehydrogenase [Bacteroidales bacterium]|nr:prephenate dehydrogenase [Bacteroidales bacterium]